MLTFLIFLHFFMADPTWGLLAKSQVDPETIEEAIQRIVDVHEADPTAHLGTGESLEAHKSDEVLDHPQGSVLADKMQNSQLVLDTAFEGVTGWTINAGAHYNELGNFTIRTTTDLNNVAEAMLEDGLPLLCEQLSKSPMYQVVFEPWDISNSIYNLNMSLVADIDNYLGFGFRVTNGAMVGLFHDGETLHSVSLGSVSNYTTYVLRAFVNIALNRVEYWINGVLIDTIPFEQHYTSDEVIMPYFSVKRTGGSGTRTLNVMSMLFARDF